MATTVDSAGPLGIPATVIHPDDALSKTWRVVSTWDLGDERGAYVEWTNQPGSWQRDGVPSWAQIVYRSDAPRRKGPQVGAAIGHGAKRLTCPSLVGNAARLDRKRAAELAPERSAYYAERGQNIDRLGWIARGLYERNGKPGPDAPFGGTPTPKIDAMPEPKPSEDALRVEAKACGIAHLLDPISVDPEQPWPTDWRHVTYGGEDWAMAEPAEWLRIEFCAPAKVYTASGLSQRFRARRRAIHSAVWNAKNPNVAGTRTATAVAVTPIPAQRPIEAPPEPGIHRAKWIGDEVTAMLPHTGIGLEPIAMRRIAARRALALVAGYEPSSPNNDAGTLVGSLSLHLAGLNAYAVRVFNGEEPDNAVL